MKNFIATLMILMSAVLFVQPVSAQRGRHHRNRQARYECKQDCKARYRECRRNHGARCGEIKRNWRAQPAGSNAQN